MKTYTAKIEDIVVKDVRIIGRYESLGLMVEWACPAENVDAEELLGVKQAGFSFRIVGENCYIASRLGYTKFTED